MNELPSDALSVIASFLDPPSRVMLWRTNSVFSFLRSKLPSKKKMCGATAECGYLNIMILSEEYNCPLDKCCSSHTMSCSMCELGGDIYTSAARGGHINVLSYLTDDGKSWTCSNKVLPQAAKYGHVNVLEYTTART